MALACLVPESRALAQSNADSPFRPSLTDPWHTQRFGRSPGALRRSVAADSDAAAPPPPSGSGETGFDSRGVPGKKKKAKRKAGDPHPAPPPPPPLPGPPQQGAALTSAPQIAARASYADAYKPEDRPQRRPLVPVQDAFDPLGVRVGTFLLKPSIDITRGLDSNPGRTPNGRDSAFTTVEPALQVRSLWARHQYNIDLRGSYSKYDSLSSSDRPMVDFKSYSRFDIRHDTSINTESRYYLSTDYPGSPNLPADIAKLPIFTTYGSSVGFIHRPNRLEISAKAGYDRTAYRDSELTDGSTFSNHDRDYNQYGAQMRVAYELWPGVKPFVEASGDQRVHDLEFDRNGQQRDSRSITPKAGTAFEISRILTGEVSIGYLRRRFEDASLPDLQGVLFDSSLVWTMSGLTTVTLNASSRGEEVVLTGVSGALRRDVSVQVDHAFRRWLIGTVRLGYGFDEYFGNGRRDGRVSLGSAITYKLSREMALRGEYRYDRLRSNTSNVDYDASTFLVGLRLQR